MATGTFYLRPSADISLGHPVYPETLGAGYLAISEETSDNMSTYIGFAEPPGESVSYTSKFKMSINEPPKITNILSVRLCGYGECHSNDNSNGGLSITQISIYVSNERITTIKDEAGCAADGSWEHVYQDGNYMSNGSNWHSYSGSYDYSGLLTALNSAITTGGNGILPDVVVEITNSTDSDETDSKNGKTVSYVSQIYLSLECEYQSDIGIHHKVNGSWVPATAAYRKVNGAWTEITADECKSILQSNLIGK